MQYQEHQRELHVSQGWSSYTQNTEYRLENYLPLMLLVTLVTLAEGRIRKSVHPSPRAPASVVLREVLVPQLTIQFAML